MNSARTYFRALRIPFLSASVLPYCLGAVAAGINNFFVFVLGLLGVACVHLSANLINDYSDSLSGADWQDLNYYGFFGGSKLIQEGVLNERFYLINSCIFAILAAIVAIYLTLYLKSIVILMFLLLGLLGGISYSVKPISLSSRCFGEFTVFICFGFLSVFGGYYLQLLELANLNVLLLAFVSASLTTIILVVNEIPDYETDLKVLKYNLLYMFGKSGAKVICYILFAIIIVSLFLLYNLSYVNKQILFIFFLLPLPIKLMKIIPYCTNKENAILAAKISIILHAIVHCFCIWSII